MTSVTTQDAVKTARELSRPAARGEARKTQFEGKLFLGDPEAIERPTPLEATNLYKHTLCLMNKDIKFKIAKQKWQDCLSVLNKSDGTEKEREVLPDRQTVAPIYLPFKKGMIGDPDDPDDPEYPNPNKNKPILPIYQDDFEKLDENNKTNYNWLIIPSSKDEGREYLLSADMKMNMIDYNSFAQHWLNATDDGEQKTSLINDIDSKTNFHKSLIRTVKPVEKTFMNNLLKSYRRKRSSNASA